MTQAWNVRAFLRCVVFSENMFKCAELSDEMTKCVEFHGMCPTLSFFNLCVAFGISSSEDHIEIK
jgi:hypothetical protein